MGHPGKDSSSSKRKRKYLLAGSLLLAHPSISGGIFRKTVILLPSHDKSGAMGIILNRPLHKRVADVSCEFAVGPLADVPVYQGGPVAKDRLLFCAWRVHPSGMGVQLMFGVAPEKACALRNQPGMELRAFYGYSGWTPGQLEVELRRSTWIALPLMPHILEKGYEDGQDERLWKKALSEISPQWHLSAEGPDDPGMN